MADTFHKQLQECVYDEIHCIWENDSRSLVIVVVVFCGWKNGTFAHTTRSQSIIQTHTPVNAAAAAADSQHNIR